MARDYSSTMSQDRMIRLFGLTSDGTLTNAQEVLIAADLPVNGIPDGMTPHAAKKLTDDALMALFPRTLDVDQVAANAASATARERAERNARIPDRSTGTYLRNLKARNRQNDELRAAGYCWQRPLGEGVDRYDADGTGWELVAADGRVVTVAEARAEMRA